MSIGNEWMMTHYALDVVSDHWKLENFNKYKPVGRNSWKITGLQFTD